MRWPQLHILPGLIVAVDAAPKREKEKASGLPPGRTRAVQPELQKDFLAHNTRLSPLGFLLEVLILGMFKSLKMEVLILRELRAQFLQVLKLRDLVSWRLFRPKVATEQLPGRARRARFVRKR